MASHPPILVNWAQDCPRVSNLKHSCLAGIISPYRLQISLIESRCRQLFSDSICDNLEVQSVDGFQGREKEIILFTLVRSNETGEIGFLIEERRLNVAITRARSHLMVVADSNTVTKECKALESFMDYCYEHGDVVSGSDYADQLAQFDDIQVDLKKLGGSNSANNKPAEASKPKANDKNNKNKKAHGGRPGDHHKNGKGKNANKKWNLPKVLWA